MLLSERCASLVSLEQLPGELLSAASSDDAH
jgi:hypothetical protein